MSTSETTYFNKLPVQRGATKWYVLDGLGSVQGEVDPSGQVSANTRYDVYGAARQTSGTRTSAHGFVGNLGHPSEANTGLIYMRARYCDPTTGRFVSEDTQHDGVNWFAYCEDSPTNMIDENGKSAVEALFGLAGALMLMGVYAAESEAFLFLGFMWAICIGVSAWAIISMHIQMDTSTALLIGTMIVGLATGFTAVGLAGGIAKGTLGLNRAEIGAFYKGYACMLVATGLILDLEVEASTG